VLSKHTSTGDKASNFITEKGIYKLLFRSRKPIAMEFQNWNENINKLT
jgi:prophage antirepressor-like protein